MITEKQIEILDYISMNGKVNVEVTPRIIKQNNALYDRIWKLEDGGYIICQRIQGCATLHTITNKGLELLQGKC